MTDKKRVVFDSKKVEETSRKIDEGYLIKREDNPFYENKIGIRKESVTFAMTQAELDEWVKCKMDIFHFAQNYCKVKTEDGTYKIIKLRDYQFDILDMFNSNQFNILMASRQIGKCIEYNTSLFIELENEGCYKEVKFFQLLFKYKEKKNIFDYIKYTLYSILNKIDR